MHTKSVLTLGDVRAMAAAAEAEALVTSRAGAYWSATLVVPQADRNKTATSTKKRFNKMISLNERTLLSSKDTQETRAVKEVLPGTRHRSTQAEGQRRLNSCASASRYLP